VTLSSGFDGSSSSSVAGAASSAGVGAAVGTAVRGAGAILGAAGADEVRGGGAVVVAGRVVVERVVVVVVGVLDVGDEVGAVVVADVSAGAEVSVDSTGCSWASWERWVRISAPATTSARNPMLITLAATRLGGFGDVGGVSVMSGSYGG
jgi:hypothetical protein